MSFSFADPFSSASPLNVGELFFFPPVLSNPTDYQLHVDSQYYDPRLPFSSDLQTIFICPPDAISTQMPKGHVKLTLSKTDFNLLLRDPQRVKNSPAMRETWVLCLGWEDPLEKGKATHSSILAWRFHGLYSPWGHKELDTTEQLSFSNTI